MTKFQGYVPYCGRQKGYGIQIKAIVLAFIFFFCLILICAMLVLVKKEDKVFNKQTFFYVCTTKSRNKIDKTKQDLVKSLGGAGVVLFYKENFNLIANVYLSEDNAKDVKNQIKTNFETAEVVKMEVKTISKSMQKKIKENFSFYKFFKYLNEIVNQLDELNMNYMSGAVSEGNMMTLLISEKLELETIIKQFENPNKEVIFENIKTYANLLLLHYENFFSEFYQSTKKQSLACMFVVNVTLTKVDLFNNL